MSDTGSSVPAPPAKNGGRRRMTAVLVSVAVSAAVLVGILTAVAAHFAKGYFLFSPGTAPVITTSTGCKASGGELALPTGQPCVHLVVPPAKVHRVKGKLLMVDVEVSTPGPLEWAEYELGVLGEHRQFVPVAAYTGVTPSSELACQDTQQMVSADQDAALAALRHLRYHVSEVPMGAEVTGVVEGAPAWDAGIHCNDLITAVNGEKVKDAAQFSDRVAPVRAGEVVTLADRPAGGGKLRQVEVRLAKTPPDRVAQGFPSRSYLGIQVGTRVQPELPFEVSVQAGDIGGPSAGLAFTLAILDTLSNGSLTGGHVVAATGTISPDGAVGEVGGVREKTVAVKRAGAQVFFVPAAEYQDAEVAAGPHLRVVPVSTLRQVLGILHRDYEGNVADIRLGS
ncbi:MAG: PDZ domain-containing protein [Acidimicrobiales bacterium]